MHWSTLQFLPCLKNYLEKLMFISKLISPFNQLILSKNAKMNLYGFYFFTLTIQAILNIVL
jgi:hypothetical protein